MSAAKQMHHDELHKPSGCKVSVPENPTDLHFEQARQELGMPKKPKYKVSAVKLRKFKQRWVGEPVGIAGQEA